MTFSFGEDNFGISLEKCIYLYLSEFLIVITLSTHHYLMGRKKKQSVQHFLLLALSDYTISAEKYHYLFPAKIQNKPGNLLSGYADISKLHSLIGVGKVQRLVLRSYCPQYSHFVVLFWPTL